MRPVVTAAAVPAEAIRLVGVLGGESLDDVDLGGRTPDDVGFGGEPNATLLVVGPNGRARAASRH